ncbi:GNAT family N-acetyltransferase [Gracilibacillus kekensis]|uniref:Protein N-acetyltransferase, RimJ/RimL family n=1 Tax=Gracilibacillus kekensis TaxID=1027249 RepID=A0A1M7QCK4_9BACI|nr:GNAT family N-acetyltransferase [Gracilibacillus kekensis]SHN28524.1 Protein N-acetyltransferase, RimJ/RimL family [Gracilibacillus kekensis]
MLKKRDVQDAPVLFDLMSDPEVFPYVRHKVNTSDEFYFLTKQTIEAEENGELISRTIVDEQYNPIGTINLFDIENNAGFLATWIGKPYFGKGYNKLAKDAFFEELFYQHDIDAVFIKIRRANVRSLKAILKIPFVMYGNESYPEVFNKINDSQLVAVYDLYVITKENYFSHTQTSAEGEEAI